MDYRNKLSHQGLKKVVDSKFAEELKTNFIVEIANKNDLATTGYFIGKGLLTKILFDNKDAAGVMVSFGFSKIDDKPGDIHIIVELAAGKTKDDEPVIIETLQKYATTMKKGPDNLIPYIKPNPPH